MQGWAWRDQMQSTAAVGSSAFAGMTTEQEWEARKEESKYKIAAYGLPRGAGRASTWCNGSVKCSRPTAQQRPTAQRQKD